MLCKQTFKSKQSISCWLVFIELRKAEIDAQLVAENIAIQLEKRVSWRRALKKAMTSALRQGLEG